MFWTIAIIARAVRLRGGSSSHFGFEVPAPVWQLPQQRLRDVVNTPIVPMNSSTVMPLSTCTFLKTFSDICGVTGVAAATCADESCCALSAGVLPVAKAMLVSHAVVAVAVEKIAPLENAFMECLQLQIDGLHCRRAARCERVAHGIRRVCHADENLAVRHRWIVQRFPESWQLRRDEQRNHGRRDRSQHRHLEDDDEIWIP